MAMRLVVTHYLIQLTTFLRSSIELAASRHRWTAQFPNLETGQLWVNRCGYSVRSVPMCHHLVATGTYGIDDLGTFVSIGHFEFLLQENGSLLVRGFDYARDELVVGGRRRRM
jgi:hypothetical protein